MIARSLAAARRVFGAATAKCAELRLKPMAVAILDARGCLKAFAAQDGTSLLRAEVAHGKAYGARSRAGWRSRRRRWRSSAIRRSRPTGG
jgi:uncharacterized protein GlcG (DUF336 family)